MAKGVIISDSVTSIGYYAFDRCTSLENVYYNSDLLSWYKIEFKDYFANPMSYASNLYLNGELLSGSVEIPAGVTTIPDYVFSGCTSLTSITIPDSVTSIGYQAFRGCTSLASIYYSGTKTQWAAVSKGYDWKYQVPATVVHCTDGDVSI